MNTLIAPLGKTPAVITETLDFLMPKYRHSAFTEPRVEIDRLVLAYPAEQEFIDISTLILEEEWVKTFKKSSDTFIRSSDLNYLLHYKDIITKQEIKDFARTIFELSLQFNGVNDQIFYSMSGGRKTMAAVMAYLAQICHVKELIHVIADDRLRNIRESNEFFNTTGALREELLYPASDKILPFRLRAESFFSPTAIKKVHHFLKKNKPSSDFNEYENLLFEFLASKPEFIDTTKMSLSLSERIDDSVQSLEKTNLNNDEKRQAASMIQKLLNYSDKIHHLKYHSQRKPRWRLYRYDHHLFIDPKMFVIEAVLPISENRSCSFHITTTADSINAGEQNWQLILSYFKTEYPKLYQQRDTEKKFALVCSLGKSPGVITEAVEYFKNKILFQKIVIIASDNREIRTNGIQRILNGYYSPELDPHYITGISEIKNESDLQKFISKSLTIIKKYQEDGYSIFLNFAGGRKTMSAAMVRIAQLAEIDHFFHVVIADSILEDWCLENGTIEALLKRQNEDRQGIKRNDGKWDAPLFPDLSKIEIIDFPDLGFQNN